VDATLFAIGRPLAFRDLFLTCLSALVALELEIAIKLGHAVDAIASICAAGDSGPARKHAALAHSGSGAKRKTLAPKALRQHVLPVEVPAPSANPAN